MKLATIISVFGIAFLSSCSSDSSKLIGSWKEVLSPSKEKAIKDAYESNVVEIDKMTSIPPGLAEQYETNNLDSLKELMKAELKQQYILENKALTYQFAKGGSLLLVNEKNGAEDSVYQYKLEGGSLITGLVKESPLVEESLFEDGGIYDLVRLTNDSLVLAITGGTFVDTVFMVKKKK